jgi:hypothetical protein
MISIVNVTFAANNDDILNISARHCRERNYVSWSRSLFLLEHWLTHHYTSPQDASET